MARRGKVEDIDRGFAALRKSLKAAGKGGSYVKVGVLGGSSRSSDSLSNAELAAVQEFGTTDGHIPARPFIGGTYDANREKYAAQIRKDVAEVYAGRRSIEDTLKRAGLAFSSDIKARVMRGESPFEPNAPETIRRKKSDRPLVDTGRLVNSVTYEVVTNGGSLVSGSKPRKG